MRIDNLMAERFQCAKCGARGARAKRIGATGTGFSKFFDIQHNHFLTLSCRQCGYTEIYDPEVLEGKRSLGTIIDVLFGG